MTDHVAHEINLDWSNHTLHLDNLKFIDPFQEKHSCEIQKKI